MDKSLFSRRQVCKILAAGPALAAMSSVASAREKGKKRTGKKQKGPKKRPKVLMPVGDGTEAVDTLYPFFRIPEDGYEVVVAGPEARLYHLVLHEVPPNSDVPWDITREMPGYHIRASVAFRDVDPAEYVGVFVSGGRAPEYLRYDQDLMRIMRHFSEAGKPIAVVCHGIEILSAAGCIRGRTVTTVAKCALDAEQGGAKYVDRPVVVDGHVVSARTWHDNTPFMKAYMKMLNAYVKKH
jgi:protease I